MTIVTAKEISELTGVTVEKVAMAHDRVEKKYNVKFYGTIYTKGQSNLIMSEITD